MYCIGKISSLKGLSSTGTGCPGKWLSHHPSRYLKDKYCGAWQHGLVGRLGTAGFMVEIEDPKKVDSVIL